MKRIGALICLIIITMCMFAPASFEMCIRDSLSADLAAFGSDRIQSGLEFAACSGIRQRGFVPAVYIRDLRIQTFDLGTHLRESCVPFCRIYTCSLCNSCIERFRDIIACRRQIHLERRLVIHVHYHRAVSVDIRHHHIRIVCASVVRLRVVMQSVPVRMLRRIF